ncbi:peptidoglycan DD-metalloendopeptidase family protein [Nocardioides humilatus]|uniref:Peptidoglycan DD-metalloendopeptidase family protein n=1 Tax=Nocardioides humilatus TaxID=2607660 RepID=A0A5B1L4X5_9ACTN|nr:peptidoglycan DD-metalloendopeptidase family protein [Nocardioides humilatus]KAA1415496.1 peptidoglycan DD-metalloendopeptidase family protein [Nocardioides humilatus]
MLQRIASLLLLLGALLVPALAGPTPVTAPIVTVADDDLPGAHALVNSPSGREWLMRVTPAGVLKTRYTIDDDPFWTDWSTIAGSYTSVAGTTATVDGARRLVMAVVTAGGTLKYATNTGTEWTAWTTAAAPGGAQKWATVAMTTDAASRAWTFATTDTGNLFYSRQQVDGSWSAWTSVARVGTTTWAAASAGLQAGTNRVWLAAAGSDGKISTFRSAANGATIDATTRAAFQCSGGPSTGFADDVAISGDASGRMWLFATRAATGALNYCQTSAGTTTWGTEKSWGAADWSGVSAAWDVDDAQMWVAGTKTSGEVLYRHTSADPSGWTAFATIDRLSISYGLYLAPGGSVTAGFAAYLTREGKHEGIDTRRYVGAPVHALVSGTVTNIITGCRGAEVGCLSTIAIYNATLEKTVVYLHTNPATTSLAVGTTVARGQTIGYEDYRGVEQVNYQTHIEMRPGWHTVAAASVCSGGEAPDAPCNVQANPIPSSFWTSQGYDPDQDRAPLGGHAVVTDRSGREWDFVITPGGTLVYRYTGMTDWNWTVFGDGYNGSSAGFRSVAATLDGSGRIWVLTTSNDGELRYRRTAQAPSSTTTGAGWDDPTAPQSAGYNWGDVAASTDDAGRVWMFATATNTIDGTADRLFYKRQNNGSWTDMTQVGAGDWRGLSSTVKDGQVWLFAVKGSDSGAYSNRIFYYKSTSDGLLSTSASEFGAGSRWADVSAATDLSGRVWVFAPTFTDGLLRYRYTTTSGWTAPGSADWGELGNGDWVSVSSTVHQGSGKVEVVAAKDDGDLWSFKTNDGSTATVPAGGGWTSELIEPGGGGRGSYGI